MPDSTDAIQETQILEGEELLIKAREAAMNMPAGYKGVCLHCDEYSPRLVYGACARCRDEMERR